jgi:hypothetical protein
MKNIHIIPTDNYSPLVYSTNKYGGYFLSRYYSPMKDMGDSYQNIYITSDEEIKEEGYVFWEGKVYKYREFMKMRTPVYTDYFSIILTTDVDLIKDGVQDIDDEFLQWFVKNPSCEYVKVANDTLTVKEMSKLPLGTRNHKYKIIIPQEEPKPHLFCETPEEKCTMNYCDENGCQNRKRELVEPQEEPKQETLEEFKKRFANDESHKNIKLDYQDGIYYGIGVGAEWQSKRMFSEEEVLTMLLIKHDGLTPEYVLEQFKKK